MSANINITIKDFIPTIIWVIILCGMGLGSVYLGLIYTVVSLIILVPIHLFWYWKDSLRKKRIIIISIYCSLAVITYGYQLYVDHYSAQVRKEIVSYVEGFYAEHQYYPSKAEFRGQFPRGYGSQYQMTALSYGVNEKEGFYQIIYVQSFVMVWSYYSTSHQWNYDYR